MIKALYVITVGLLFSVRGSDVTGEISASNSNEITNPKPHRFAWAVKDEASHNDYGHQETSDGKVVVGSYRVLLPDGRTQIVTYQADDKGYVASVKYEVQVNFQPSTEPSPTTGYSTTLDNATKALRTENPPNKSLKQSEQDSEEEKYSASTSQPQTSNTQSYNENLDALLDNKVHLEHSETVEASGYESTTNISTLPYTSTPTSLEPTETYTKPKSSYWSEENYATPAFKYVSLQTASEELATESSYYNSRYNNSSSDYSSVNLQYNNETRYYWDNHSTSKPVDIYAQTVPEHLNKAKDQSNNSAYFYAQAGYSPSEAEVLFTTLVPSFLTEETSSIPFNATTAGGSTSSSAGYAMNPQVIENVDYSYSSEGTTQKSGYVDPPKESNYSDPIYGTDSEVETDLKESKGTFSTDLSSYAEVTTNQKVEAEPSYEFSGFSSYINDFIETKHNNEEPSQSESSPGEVPVSEGSPTESSGGSGSAGFTTQASNISYDAVKAKYNRGTRYTST